MKHFSRIRLLNERRPRVVNFSMAFAAVLLSCVLIEFFFRMALHYISPKFAADIQNHIAVVTQEKTEKRYISHPYLSYVRKNISYERGGIKIGERFFSTRKNPDTVRVACLGGSTTMYQYPRYLEGDLSRRSLGRKFEVMDFGVSGWTLMESTVNYMIRVADFHPDVVLIHHGMNDCFPRVWPDYRPDYSHYRLTWQDQSRWMDSKILANSWIFAYVQVKRGAARTALQNYTVRHLDPKDVTYKPEIGSLSTYRSNLRNIANLIRSSSAQIVFAPMAYNRNLARKTYESLIEEQNNCMRRVANDARVPLAEADAILTERSDRYLDLVHLKDSGNRIKSIVYASEIVNALYGLPHAPLEREMDREHKIPSDIELEISWDLNVDGVERCHVYLYDDIAGKAVYLGQTDRGDRNSLVWKSGSMQIAERFRKGPAIGRSYRFQIFAILKNDAHAFKGPFTEGIHVKEISEKTL